MDDHPSRLDLLPLLTDGERPVGDLDATLPGRRRGYAEPWLIILAGLRGDRYAARRLRGPGGGLSAAGRKTLARRGRPAA